MSAVRQLDSKDFTHELSFIYGDEKIVCVRLPRKHNNKRIMIKVRPDCLVEVNAPIEADDQEVIDALKKRGRWIFKQLREFRKQREFIAPRNYISGESHYYLGKQYMLKVIENASAKQGVKMLRGNLEVTLRAKDREKVCRLLNEWYRKKAKAYFEKRLAALLEHTLWVELKPNIKVMSMKSQWGNCSRNGVITLNLNLIKAPTKHIDYVIFHELCHLIEHNHNENFYRMLKQVMPDWETVKKDLDLLANRYQN